MLNLLKPKKTTEAHVLSTIVEQKSSSIINLIGYVILGLTCLDYAMILIPPQLLNPAWEVQTIGQFVEHSWSILLGLILIFYRRSNDYIRAEELYFVSLLSRLTLFLGIAYFLAIPLLLSDTIRLSSQNSSVVNQQITLQSEQVEDFATELNQKSQTELEQLIKNYSQSNNNLNFTSPEDFKTKILANIKTQKESNRQQIKQTLKNKQTVLYKNAFKWTIGAVLTGFSLLFIWNSTQWTRVLQREQFDT